MKEIQPLIKPLVCPRCGCKAVEEIADGLIETTSFEWDEKLNRYRGYDSDTDGNGDRYLQCAECAYEYPEETLEQFDMSDPEYQL